MNAMQTSTHSETRWEFAQVQIVKGTLGGLYLTYMTAETPCQTYKVLNSISLDNKESEPPLFQLLAQMGAQSWDIIQYLPPNYLLKRPLNLCTTVFNNLEIIEHCVK